MVNENFAQEVKHKIQFYSPVTEVNYSEEKVADWMSRLEKVYNRGFWGGYFLRQHLGEWTDASGSKATVKKVFLGKGMHYCSKAQHF